MQLFITILHVVLCIALTGIILLQPGKDQGSVFGGGSGGNKMYGPRGQGNFLGRATTVVAVMFMVTSITLAWFSTERVREGSNIDDALEEAQQEEDAANDAAPNEPLPTELPVVPSPTPDVPPPTDGAGLAPAPADGAAPAPAGEPAPAPAPADSAPAAPPAGGNP